MTLDIRWAIVIAIGLIIAAFVHGGIYQMSAGNEVAWRVNKFTGSVQACAGIVFCREPRMQSK